MRRERKEKTIVSGLCHRLGGLSAVVDAHFSERKERQKCLKKKLRARISERERRNFERKHHLRGKKGRKSQQIEDKKTCLQMNSQTSTRSGATMLGEIFSVPAPISSFSLCDTSFLFTESLLLSQQPCHCDPAITNTRCEVWLCNRVDNNPRPSRNITTR